MILVVADTSPLNYLIQIRAIGILPRFFDQVVIPSTVLAELLHRSAPAAVRKWAEKLPSWAVTQTARSIPPLGLHPGETEALALATELRAFAILLDDGDARATARSLGVTVMGTVGLLERAAAAEILDLETAFQALRRTNYRISEEVLQAALTRDRECRKKHS